MSSQAAPTSDLSTRFAAAVAMIAVASVVIYLGGWPFRILVALGAGIMLFEWGEMHRTPRTLTYIGIGLLVLSLLGLSEWLFPAAQRDPAEIELWMLQGAWPGFLVLAGLAVVLGLAGRRLSLGWGFLYVALPSFALLALSWTWFELVFWLMLVTWATDIFAYFAGRAIGGPKLAPRISPNKTWAGLIGGMAGAAIIGAAAASLFELESAFYLAGGVMGLIAQLGDLYESKVKRAAGVKDSGSLLPGHGGVLDRLDGLLPVIVATFLLLAVVLGTA